MSSPSDNLLQTILSSREDKLPIIDGNVPIDELDYDGQKKLIGIREGNQSLDHKKYLVWWTMGIVTFWLLSVILILLLNFNTIDLNCIKKVYKGPHLSDGVLIALLGTTTLNVLGLAFIVLRGYFGNVSNKVD